MVSKFDPLIKLSESTHASRAQLSSENTSAEQITAEL